MKLRTPLIISIGLAVLVFLSILLVPNPSHAPVDPVRPSLDKQTGCFISKDVLPKQLDYRSNHVSALSCLNKEELASVVKSAPTPSALAKMKMAADYAAFEQARYEKEKAEYDYEYSHPFARWFK